jgi:hypothetical protein
MSLGHESRAWLPGTAGPCPLLPDRWVSDDYERSLAAQLVEHLEFRGCAG